MTEVPAPPRLLVSVTEIRRHLGSRLAVESHLEAEGLRLSDVAVVDGADIVLEADVESISDGVVLTGSVHVPWVGACRRCLRDVHGVASVDVREVYETRPVEGETWPLLGDQIDVGPLLHDTALLALPLAPLCGDDCQGPAPEAFPAVAPTGDDDGADHADEPPRDPRWAALDDLDL
jgi:uncharacterized protein